MANEDSFEFRQCNRDWKLERDRSERDYEPDKNKESLIHSPIGMARWIVAAALLGTFIYEL